MSKNKDKKRYVEKKGLYQNEYTNKEYAMDNEMKVSLDFEMNVSYLLQKQKMFQILMKREEN